MSENDTPVWMYKGQEPKLFNSANEIPQGEGWRDAPYELVEPEPVEAQKLRGKKQKIEAVDPEVTEEVAPNGDSD